MTLQELFIFLCLYFFIKLIGYKPASIYNPFCNTGLNGRVLYGVVSRGVRKGYAAYAKKLAASLRNRCVRREKPGHDDKQISELKLMDRVPVSS